MYRLTAPVITVIKNFDISKPFKNTDDKAKLEMNNKKDVSKPKFGLVIVNWDYYGGYFTELLYPEQDGKYMEKTLATAGYRQVKVINNVRDIESCVKDYLEEFQLIEMERFHFHYSGNQNFQSS